MPRVILILSAFLIMEGIAAGAEIIVPYVKARVGELIHVPVLVDRAESLAGVKLAISYEKGLMAFKAGKASKYAHSLSLVINDKTPGQLIVGMAGAKGISGKNMPLLTLTFQVKKGLRGAMTTRLNIPEVQLVSDRLNEIKSKVVIKPLDIVP